MVPASGLAGPAATCCALSRCAPGARSALAARSPLTPANPIKVPVLLAAGGKDERARVEHTQRVECAVKGGAAESLYFPNEGHGFFTEPHRRGYDTRVLAFLRKHLGSSTAKRVAAVSSESTRMTRVVRHLGAMTR
ncbi:alpha/beta hydrolase family protein [Xanthomonas euvesicatoria]|uniref:alpha/beta hydrolase family protein n=1 Tax=Xanthomonas euvesicatoria TaxID=456327 RepID=UPI0032B60F84